MSFPTAYLADVADVNWGNTSITKASYTSTGFPAYSATGCDGFLPEFEYDTEGIILSAIGAECGKCFSAKGKWTAIKNTITLTPHKSTKADFRFLFYFLNRKDLWPRRGVGQPFIGLGDARKVRIPFPSLPEQRRIAAILDKADELRAKRRAALAQLDTLTQSIFLDMFGDPGTNPKGWSWRRLGDVTAFVAGSTLPEGEDFTGQRDGHFLLKVSDMNLPGNEVYLETCQLWSEVPGADSCTCPSGSVVIPKRGGAIATNKKRITTRSSVLDPNLMAIVPWHGQVELQFLYAWLLRLDLAFITSGSSVPQLNKRDLEPLSIAVPPVLLQRQFSHRVAEVEKIVGDHRRAARNLDALFASLQHRAFLGEL